MKEQYSPMEPIKEGIKITGGIGKSVFESVKPYLKYRLQQKYNELNSIIFREK